MFTIIGGDGKEYGPVTTEQVRNWIVSGRANLETKAKAAGSDEWRRLADFAEFGGIDGGLPPLIAAVDISTDAPLAGLGLRFTGALIDGVLQMLCWLPMSLPFGRALREQIETGQLSLPSMIATYNEYFPRALPYLGALILAQACLLSFRGQSIGKLVVRTQIVRTRTNERAGFLRAYLLRGFLPWLVEQIPLLGKLFWLVDTCFIFGDQRRCLHDLIADTKVVKV